MSDDWQLNLLVLRCEITGNPYGTDTRAVTAPPCMCASCQASARIAELEAERDSIRDKALEEAAVIADKHKGSAAKDRQRKGLIVEPTAWEIIDSEEHGEDIASEMIAKKIRALKGGKG